MTFEEICSVFGANGSGDKRKCKCPAHADKQDSLSISRGSNGKTVIYCHAGCDTGSVLSAKGLKFSDLDDGSSRSSSGDRWKSYVESAMSRKAGKQLKIEGVYNFLDLSGKYCYSKIRLTGKNMVYGKIQEDRFNWGLGGQSRKTLKAVFTKSVTEIRAAAARGDRIYYAEGEKDVLTLQSHGYLAVTAGGCSDWQKEFSELFRGADAVILADNDRPGLKLAHEVEQDLKGIAADVTVITPVPDVEKADITDFFERGGTDQDLQQLIEDCKKAKKLERKQANNLENNQSNSMAQDLDRFHLIGKNGQISGVYDWEIFCYLKGEENILILGGTPYIYKNGVYEADPNGARLKTMIRGLIYPEFIKSHTLKRIYDLFLTDDELQITFEDLNAYPESWICFRNGMYDPIKKQLIPHDPKYRAVNQIPHEYDPEGQLHGEAVESWLNSTFEKPDDREMLLQYIGLCLTRDTKQQKFLILNGLGGTGKSGLIGLVVAIVGDQNCSHVPLEKLSERFTAFELLGKLLNSCADLRISALEDVSLLKQVLGEDSLRGEAKGKDGVNFRSYAKLLFSVNELPAVKSERTNGFYRRLLILTMNKIPEKVNVNLFSQLREELPYLIKKSVEALGRMYEAGTITESENSKAAVTQMMKDSDTVEAWISDTMFRVTGARSKRAALFNLYSQYCEKQERQALQRNNFFKALRSKGFSEVKSDGEWMFKGISASERPQISGETASKTALQNCPTTETEDLPFS